jgi:type III secretory pathway component EscS
MVPRQTLTRELPPGYREARYLSATEGRVLLWLNLLSLIPLVIALTVVGVWGVFVQRLRGPLPSVFWENVPWLLAVIVVIVLMIVLHEWIHGLTIQWVGYKPRYGINLSKGVFFATTDNGLFRRDQFIIVALAPLVVITLVGMILMIFTPDSLGYYIGLIVVMNAGGAVGDLWMAAVVSRYSEDTLVRDEADSIRIYTRPG